jgi:hypothetical protein
VFVHFPSAAMITKAIVVQILVCMRICGTEERKDAGLCYSCMVVVSYKTS